MRAKISDIRTAGFDREPSTVQQASLDEVRAILAETEPDGAYVSLGWLKLGAAYGRPQDHNAVSALAEALASFLKD